MANRSVSVKLSLEVAAYLANARRAEEQTKDLREEVDRLEKAGASMAKSGALMAAIAGLPGMASAGVAAVGLLSGAMFGGAAAAAAMAVATNGVGTAMTAVAEGDSAALSEAMGKLAAEARDFVRSYERVKPTLDALGDSTQSRFFAPLIGDLEQLTGAYLPTLMRQLPRLAGQVGGIASDWGDWAAAPATVAKVNGQMELGIHLADHLGRMLRAGTAILLDMADAGSEFTANTVGGLADGTEALQRWVAAGRATGQLNTIFENGGRILQEVGEIAGEAGVLIADIADNPALVDGAEALFDVMGLGLDVVQGLLTAFEGLPGGMQTGIVTMAVYGGAVLMVTSRVLALKAALDTAKISAREQATAMRGIGGMLGGPWGIALTVATVAVGAFAASQSAAKQKVQDLANTLDTQTGAITDNTRAWVANELSNSKALATFRQMGVEGDRVVDAALGDKAAYDELTAAIDRYRAAGEKGNITRAQFATDEYLPQIRELTGQLGDAAIKEGEVRQAVEGTTGAITAQTREVRTLADELRKQTDPMFALITAQQDLTAKQEAYNAAVKEHGKGSAQAKAASLDLAKASVELAGAVDGLGGTFTGSLTPQMYATLRAANLTSQQIADIEKGFQAAAASGQKFAGDYTANVNAETAAAQAALDAVIAKTLQLKDKSIRISAQVYWTDKGLKVPGGTLLANRWGGVYTPAATGALRDAAVYSPVSSGARYAYAEPQTGGEAFVPKFGNYDRSMSILSEAARWYGASVVAGGQGGGGSGTAYSTNNTINVYPRYATWTPADTQAQQRILDVRNRVDRQG